MEVFRGAGEACHEVVGLQGEVSVKPSYKDIDG